MLHVDILRQNGLFDDRNTDWRKDPDFNILTSRKKNLLGLLDLIVPDWENRFELNEKLLSLSSSSKRNRRRSGDPSL
jgi:hypothetical protein